MQCNEKCMLNSVFIYCISFSRQEKKVHRCFDLGLIIDAFFVTKELAPVVQRPDSFIPWISHYTTVSICAKISVFSRVQAKYAHSNNSLVWECTKTLDNI